MQTVREFTWLVRNSLSLWRVHLPVLLVWLAGGWAAREVCFHVAVLFGPNRAAAMLCFALGMVIWVVSIIGMLFTVTRAPKAFDVVDTTAKAPTIRQRRWGEVMVEAVVPFLAVYAVWGLTQEQVQRAFTANLTYWGLDAANFSISFSNWQLYIVVTVIAWALQWVIGLFVRGRRKGLLVSLLLTFLRGVAILTAFIGLDTLWIHLTSWLRQRRVWGWVEDGWEGVVAALPHWNLPFDMTLPEAALGLGAFVRHGLLPGLLGAILLPLLWVALTAMTVGWNDFTGGVSRSRLSSALNSTTLRARETARRMQHNKDLGPVGLVRKFVLGQLEPLWPIVESFTLIMRSGLPLLGAYLVLAAVVRALSGWINDVVVWLIGPNSFADTVRYASVTELFAELVAWPLAICVYASAFDRALLVTLDEADQEPGVNPMASDVSPPNLTTTRASSSADAGTTQATSTILD